MGYWEELYGGMSNSNPLVCDSGRLIARVHSAKNVDAQGIEQLEPNYYISEGYPRRYFAMEDVRALFGAWAHLDAQEMQIVRFGRVKQVIEFASYGG